MRRQEDGGQFLVGDLDLGGVDASIALRLDVQPGPRGDGADQLDDDLVADEGAVPAP